MDNMHKDTAEERDNGSVVVQCIHWQDLRTDAKDDSVDL